MPNLYMPLFLNRNKRDISARVVTDTHTHQTATVTLTAHVHRGLIRLVAFQCHAYIHVHVWTKQRFLTFIPKACIRVATSRPILPSPTIARVFPSSSTPMYRLRSQRPTLREAWPWGMCLRNAICAHCSSCILATAIYLATALMRAQVCSAALMVLPPGVLEGGITLYTQCILTYLHMYTLFRPQCTMHIVIAMYIYTDAAQYTCTVHTHILTRAGNDM